MKWPRKKYRWVVPGEVVRETEKAYLVEVEDGGTDRVWIPKSQVKMLGVPWDVTGELRKMTVPRWLTRDWPHRFKSNSYQLEDADMKKENERRKRNPKKAKLLR